MIASGDFEVETLRAYPEADINVTDRLGSGVVHVLISQPLRVQWLGPGADVDLTDKY